MNYSIWDLDNCILDDSWRIPFIDWTPGLNGDQRYERYHSMCLDDKPGNIDVFREVTRTTTPVFFTARPEPVREKTLKSLSWHFRLHNPFMLMRGVAEFVPSVKLKLKMLNDFRMEMGRGDKIVSAFDDREDIVTMYRREGIDACKLFIHAECAYTNPTTKEKPDER